MARGEEEAHGGGKKEVEEAILVCNFETGSFFLVVNCLTVLLLQDMNIVFISSRLENIWTNFGDNFRYVN